MSEPTGWRLEKVELDEELVANGRWAPVGGGRAEVCVRPASNADFTRYMESRLKRYESQVNDGSLDPRIQAEISAAAVARHVLVNWKGIYLDQDTKPAKFTVELAEKALLKHPRLMLEIIQAATNESHYQKQQNEEAEESLGND